MAIDYTILHDVSVWVPSPAITLPVCLFMLQSKNVCIYVCVELDLVVCFCGALVGDDGLTGNLNIFVHWDIFQ